MTDPSEMTLDEIDASLADINKQYEALHEQRDALETARRARSVKALGEMILEAFQHRHFRVSFDCQPTVKVRMLDSRCFDEDDDLDERVQQVLPPPSEEYPAACVMGGHHFLVRSRGNFFYVWPREDTNVAAWSFLEGHVQKRSISGGFDTRFSLASLDVALPFIRRAASTP